MGHHRARRRSGVARACKTKHIGVLPRLSVNTSSSPWGHLASTGIHLAPDGAPAGVTRDQVGHQRARRRSGAARACKTKPSGVRTWHSVTAYSSPWGHLAPTGIHLAPDGATAGVTSDQVGHHRARRRSGAARACKTKPFGVRTWHSTTASSSPWGHLAPTEIHLAPEGAPAGVT